jgi:hypothetical protein
VVSGEFCLTTRKSQKFLNRENTQRATEYFFVARCVFFSAPLVLKLLSQEVFSILKHPSYFRLKRKPYATLGEHTFLVWSDLRRVLRSVLLRARPLFLSPRATAEVVFVPIPLSFHGG